MTPEKRKPTTTQFIFQMIVPGVILAMLTWNTSTVSDMKVQIALAVAHSASIDNTLSDIRKEFHDELYNHAEESRKWATRNAIDHHRATMTPCNKCHGKGGE